MDKETKEMAWQISETITEILDYRGVPDMGKNFLEDVEERIIPIVKKYCTPL